RQARHPARRLLDQGRLEQERPVLRAIREAIERTEGLCHLRSRRRSTTVATTSASASAPPPPAPGSQHPAALGAGIMSLPIASLATGQLYDAGGLQPSCAQTAHQDVAHVIAWTVSAAHATASVRSW